MLRRLVILAALLAAVPVEALTINTASFGTPYTYATNANSASAAGDTFESTWCSDNNLYMAADDPALWNTVQGYQSNGASGLWSTVSGTTPGSGITGSWVNAAAAWVGVTNNQSFKNYGMLCIGSSGTDNLYTFVSRDNYPWGLQVTLSSITPVMSMTSGLAHGFSVGQQVMFATSSTDTLATGLSLNKIYYIISAGFTSTQFEVSATPGGSAITPSDTGSGNQFISANGYRDAQSQLQLVVSSNHGTSFVPTPQSTGRAYQASDCTAGSVTTTHSCPMWAGSDFTGAGFVNYGKGYTCQYNGFTCTGGAGAMPDNSGTYAYAISSGGFWTNGSSMILGRVALSNIANLQSSDWTYYSSSSAGGSCTANWCTSTADATPVISAPNTQNTSFGGLISTAAIQYIPANGVYLCITTNYPYSNQTTPLWSGVGPMFAGAWTSSQSTALSIWTFWQAPHPWGPWTQFQQTVWNPQGYYTPYIMPNTISSDGTTMTIFTTGNWKVPGNGTPVEMTMTLTYH